jgi:hypothetical protein
MNMRPVGTELLHAEREKDGRTEDRRDEANSRLTTVAVFKYRMIQNFLAQTYALRPPIQSSCSPEAF